MSKKKVAVVSLGCSKNLVDTENMLGLLCDDNFELTMVEEQADVILVNTCGFIESAKEESIQAILNLSEYKKINNSKIIVTGCLVQRYKDEIMDEIPEIDAILGTGDIMDVVDVMKKAISGDRVYAVGEPGYRVDKYIPRIISNPGSSAYIKIAEGCNNRCTYCAIPYLRGDYRSKSMELIEQEALQLVQNGAREIILIAQDTTRYGYDLYGDYKLPQLIEILTRIPDVKWLRIMYCYPTHFSNQLISTIAQNPKVCKYIDLPLQHASDRILSKMHRRGNIQDIKNLIVKIRAAIPDITLRTSFIVGFPGETEKDFEELMSFMTEMRFDKVGVFKYSLEEGTPAADMPQQVEEKIKNERYHKAMQLQQDISYDINKSKIGRRLEVLIEGENMKKNGHYVGRSQGDAPEVDGLVYIKAGKKIEIGELYPVKVTEVSEYDLMGVLIKDEFA